MQRMTRPRGYANGIVATKEPIRRPMPDGNGFTEVRIDMEPRQRKSGKVHQQEVIVRIFGDAGERATKLKMGDRIHVSGDFDVEQTHALNGKTFANLVILARQFNYEDDTSEEATLE